MAHVSVHVREADRGRSPRAYWPLVSLILVSGLAAAAIAAGWDEDPQPSGMAMHQQNLMILQL